MSDSNFCYNCFSESSEEVCPCCGYVSNGDNDDGISLEPGTVLNNTYKIGRVLGTGGFGITYKAQNIKTEQIVAVKEYVPMNMVYRDLKTSCLEVKISKNRDLFEKGLMSFIEEANFLVLLKHNPNIVNIYSCFNENNTAYFAMEFLDGRTLDNVKEMNFNLAYRSMIKTAEALKTIHSKGILHRDISPQNIFYTRNNKIKLIDFGNARFINREEMNDERLILKPGFAPPELYMKENVQGPWTDIYSLAATFYRLVTNIKLPNALERINGKAIIPIRKSFSKIDYGLETALTRALELDYDKRPRSIDEFLNDINNPPKINDDVTAFYDTAPAANYKEPAYSGAANSAVSYSGASYNGAGYNRNANTAKPAKTKPPKKSILAPPPADFGRPSSRRNSRVNSSPRNIPLNAYVIAYDGRKYPLSDIRGIVIGRDFNTSHIIVNDPAISRKHCVVECSVVKREFYLTDWSSNGTFLANGTKIGCGTKYTLQSDSEFYIYSQKYKFKVVIE